MNRFSRQPVLSSTGSVIPHIIFWSSFSVPPFAPLLSTRPSAAISSLFTMAFIKSISMALLRYLPALLLLLPAALCVELQSHILFNLRTPPGFTHPRQPGFPHTMHGSYLKVGVNNRLIGWTKNDDWTHAFLTFVPLNDAEYAVLQEKNPSNKIEDLGRVGVRYNEDAYLWL